MKLKVENLKKESKTLKVQLSQEKVKYRVSETFTVRGEYSGIGVEKLSMYILIRLLILRLLNQVKLEELNYILRDRKRYNIKEEDNSLAIVFLFRGGK